MIEVEGGTQTRRRGRWWAGDRTRRLPRRGGLIPLALGLCVLLVAQSLPSAQARQAGGQARAAQGAAVGTYGNRETVIVALNQSRVIKLRTEAARVSVANPEIADLLVLDPHQIYVVGKRLGTTNVVLWDAKDQVRGMIALEVTPDLDMLKSRLHEVLPGERVQVRAAQGAIVVSGEVSSPSKAEAAVQLARSFVGAEGTDDQSKVLNMIQVGGSQQVMLEVKVAEISRTLSKRLDLGLTSFYNGGNNIKIGTVGGGAAFPFGMTTPPGGVATAGYPNVNAQTAARANTGIAPFYPTATTIVDKGILAQFMGGNFLFNLAIDAAKDQGLARILAEPNLTTLSGQEAKFLAGGQIPYPVQQAGTGGAGSTTTVQFQDYGVAVQFVPFVLDSGVISLKVNVSVSEPDYTNAIAVSGYLTPSLKTRTANATVEVKTGQTISIAGLISERLRENLNKFPGLGDVPVLGMLFRSQDFLKDQTELVIFVTPRLARSFDPQQVKLPAGSFVEPSDLEFYLMGRMQGRKPRSGDAAPAGALGPDKSGSEGSFGHDL